jgi:hypothetical protein
MARVGSSGYVAAHLLPEQSTNRWAGTTGAVLVRRLHQATNPRPGLCGIGQGAVRGQAGRPTRGLSRLFVMKRGVVPC